MGLGTGGTSTWRGDQETGLLETLGYRILGIKGWQQLPTEEITWQTNEFKPHACGFWRTKNTQAISIHAPNGQYCHNCLRNDMQ